VLLAARRQERDGTFGAPTLGEATLRFVLRFLQESPIATCRFDNFAGTPIDLGW
jgi:hypothetical protein